MEESAQKEFMGRIKVSSLFLTYERKRATANPMLTNTFSKLKVRKATGVFLNSSLSKLQCL